MYYKTITKEIFDSYIANDSDFILKGVLTNTFEGKAFRRIMSKHCTSRISVLSLWLWA